MFNKAFATAVLALSASRLVSAQTFTDCDPTKKSKESPIFNAVMNYKKLTMVE